MSLEIYPADLSTRHGLYAATAITMSENYNDVGKISIVVALDDYAITALKPGNIVYNTDRGTTYILVNVKSDTTKRLITANGYTADWLLNKRVVAKKRQIATIEADTYDLISLNLRGLSRIDLAPVKGLTETFQKDDPETEDEDESVINGGQLLDRVTEVLDYGKLGRRMLWDTEKLRWPLRYSMAQTAPMVSMPLLLLRNKVPVRIWLSTRTIRPLKTTHGSNISTTTLPTKPRLARQKVMTGAKCGSAHL